METIIYIIMAAKTEFLNLMILLITAEALLEEPILLISKIGQKKELSLIIEKMELLENGHLQMPTIV